MQGTLNQIYSVKGTGFSTTELNRALSRAKEVAQKAKESAVVLLNNKPEYLIDKKGKLLTA